jgi:hypothetical protein
MILDNFCRNTLVLNNFCFNYRFIGRLGFLDWFNWMIFGAERAVLAKLQILEFDHLQVIMVEHHSAGFEWPFLNQK